MIECVLILSIWENVSEIGAQLANEIPEQCGLIIFHSFANTKINGAKFSKELRSASGGRLEWTKTLIHFFFT